MMGSWKSSIHRRPKIAQHIVDLICSVKVHNIVYLADKNGVKNWLIAILIG